MSKTVSYMEFWNLGLRQVPLFSPVVRCIMHWRGHFEFGTLEKSSACLEKQNLINKMNSGAFKQICKYRSFDCLVRYTSLLDIGGINMVEVLKVFKQLEFKFGHLKNSAKFLKYLSRRSKSKMNSEEFSEYLALNFVLNVIFRKKNMRSPQPFFTVIRTARDEYQKAVTNVASDRADILTSNHFAYFCSQLGEEFYFELIMELCGYEYDEEENRVYIDWNYFKTCMENENSVDDMFLKYTNFSKEQISGLTLSFEGEQNEEEFLEETPSLRRFGDLCRLVLKRPVNGYHLVCRVHGDKLMIPVLRIAFMDSVAVHGLSLTVEKPHFNTVESRIKSFKDNVASFDASVEDAYFKYAEAGFLMTNSSNLVMCFKCGGLVVLELQVDPWYKHASWHPRCRFLREQKGKQYIDEVRETLRQQIERTDSYELEFSIDRIIDNDASDSESESDNDSAWSSESDYFSDSDN